MKKASRLKDKPLDHADSTAPRISDGQDGEDTGNPKKRKRNELDESDPTFREYLQVMQPSSKRAGGVDVESVQMAEAPRAAEIKATESDDEYEEVPARQKAKTPRAPEGVPDEPAAAVQPPEKASQPEEVESAPARAEESQPSAPAVSKGATDDEWLRSRTSRVLDLLDDDEAPPVLQPTPAQGSNDQGGDAEMTGTEESRDPAIEAPQPESVKDDESAAAPQQEEKRSENADVEMIQKTARLFVRNLPYSTTEDDLSNHFGRYGRVEEVRAQTPLSLAISSLWAASPLRPIMMNPEIGTSDANVQLM